MNTARLNFRHLTATLRLLLVALLSLLCFAAPAQAADWAKNFDATASGAAIITATIVDSSGNTYVAGYFTGATMTLGATALTKVSTQDAFVAKLDASGGVLWAKNYGGSGAFSQANAIAVDTLGNVYLGGYFSGADLSAPALTLIGAQDAFALKLDAGGATTWAKNYGGASAQVNAVAVDASGNVYLGGSFKYGNLSAPALTKIGTQDAFALKLDAGGNTTWAKNYGGSGGASAQANAVAVDASGNVYLGGYFGGANLTTPALTMIGNSASSDVFVFKLGTNGTTTWAKNFGGSGASNAVGVDAQANAIAVDASGNVYLGGYFGGASLTTPALTKIGGQDAFVFKLDTNGTTTWARNYGGSGAFATANALAVDASGNVYLGGYFFGADLSTPALTKIGTYDAFALKLDTGGATTWARNYGGNGPVRAYGNAVAVDASSNVYLGGYFSGANLTTPALTKLGSSDAFLLKRATLPTVTGIAPASGSVPGGTTVTLTGVNFSGASAVHFGANQGTGLMVSSDTSITVTTPASSTGAVDVTVTTPSGRGGTGNGLFTYVDAPAQPAAPTVSLSGNIASVSFTAPANNGSAITGYTVSTSPAGGVDLEAGSTATTHHIVGLAVGTAYRFSVVAANAIGSSSASSAASASTPAGYSAQSFGSLGAPTQITAMAVDSAGNTTIAGYFNGTTLTLGATTLTRIGNQDAFVAKLDASGTVLWARNYGGSGATAQATAIAVDASGNVYLGGYFNTANLTTPALTRIGTNDAFALKLDAGGTVLWARNYGGSWAYAWANVLAVDASGNVYLGGSFSSANLSTPALTRIGNYDAFALKLDTGGNTTWAKNYGGSGGGSAQATAIAVDASGNVYLGGSFSSANISTPALTKIGNRDAFALKLDANGATTWARNYGGSGASAFANGIAVDALGNVYLGGSFQYGNLSTPALTRIGSQDAFALKLDANGVTTWARNYGGSGASAFANGIAVDASGNVYLGGSFQYGNLSTPALTRIGSTDTFAFKLDSGGTATWVKNYGGSGANAYATGIAVDASGNVYLGGSFSSAGLSAPALTLIGGQDAFLIKDSTPPAQPMVSTTSGNGQATLTFAAPVDGGAAITGYTVVAMPAGGSPITLSLNGVTVATTVTAGGLTATITRVAGANTVITLTGLVSGVGYRFTVVAINASGASPASSPSAMLTSAGASAAFSGGTWALSAAQSAGFIPTTGHAKSPPSLPSGYTFPNGMFDFTLTGGRAGSTATITLSYPSALPPGTVYWKYGPSPNGYGCNGAACASAHWYQMPPAQAVVSGNTITLTISDGGVGDDDLAANGIIADAGGPGVPVDAGVVGVPTLSEWGMAMLAVLLALFGWSPLRRLS